MNQESANTKRCRVCILPLDFPGLSFNADGVCALCTSFASPPKPLGEDALLKAVRESAGKNYDCVVPLSGGKDSSYVLYFSVKRLGLRVLAVNYDSGFQSAQARQNVAAACAKLHVPLKVFNADPKLRLGLMRQVVGIASLTGTPVGVCGNCENAIRQYSVRAARESGAGSILFGDSEMEKTARPIATGLSRILRRTSAKNLPGLLKVLSAYYVTASRERRFMGVPVREAFRPSMAPVPFPEHGARVLHFFDYIPWETMEKQELLAKELDWQASGNRMDRFDCVLHPLDNLASLQETGISKDGFIYANLVRAGVMSREQALASEMAIEEAVRRDCLEFVKQHGLDTGGVEWISW